MRVLRVVAVVASLGIVALLTVPGLSQAATSTMKDVFVINGPSDPVPTQAVGTTQVAGGVNVTGGSVAVSSGSVTVGNGTDAPVPVSITDQPIAVEVQNAEAAAAAPQPWQRVVPMQISGSSAFAAAYFDVPADQAITITKIGLADLFDATIKSVTVLESCDFSDGQTGLGGYSTVPIPPAREGADRAIDHDTTLHLSPGSCVQLYVVLDSALAPGSSLSFNLALSGSSLAAPTAADASPGMSSSQALSRSLASKPYQDLLKSIGVSAADVKASL